MITHLPARSSVVNGYGSPSNSWNGHEHSAHSYGQETGSVKIEQTGKKKKKRKKAGVAMIAESADVEESYYIDKVIQMHRDLDLHDTNQKSKICENEIGDGEISDNSRVGNDILTTALDAEETSSEISLTMELPVSQTLLQEIITDKFQHPSSAVTDREETLSNVIASEETTILESPVLEEKVCTDEDVLNTTKESSEEKDFLGLKTEGTEELNSNFNSDHSTGYEKSFTIEENYVADTGVASSPEVESKLSSQNPFECLADDETDASNQVAEKDDNTNESETPEHFAALATFECGAPKQVDSIWQIEKERALSNTSYEGEDFNVIPGIHKNADRHSLSGSSGSFNGSGSFQLGSQRSSRNNTMDSIARSSTFGSSAASDSWPNRSGSSSRKNSKAESTVGLHVGSPGSEFSEYEMFDELLGLEEDHFSPPEVSVLNFFFLFEEIM